LDLELVPKENRIDIEKCNGRIPCGLTPREPTFQVVLDAIALTSCYPAFLITTDVPEICPRVHGREFDPLPFEEDTMSFLIELGHNLEINSLNDVVVDQMHQPWRTFIALINQSLSGKTSGLDKLRLSRAQILWGMFHQKNVDYVELLWEDFIYQIENRVYKKQEKIFVSAKESSQIYGAVLPECLTSPEMKESKAYKTYLGHATGAVPPKIARKFKKASPTKKDSDLVPVDEEPVTKGKRVKRSAKKSSTTPAAGIDLLSEVALTEKALLKEVRKKSLRDFHKTHPSGSGTEKEDESDDDNQEEGEVDKENEFEYDEIESDEDKGMGDTTDQFDDDEDARLEESTQTGKEVIQGEGANVEMIDAQQGNENLETTQEQVVKDAHVTISTVTKTTEVPATSSSRSSDLASKFLNFSDIPHTDAEIVSPFDVPVQHEVPNIQTTTLLPIHVSVITTIPQSLHTFTPPPLVSTPTPPPTTEATNPLSTLPDFASVFRFNNRIIALEKEVAELKKDPLHTQVTTLVDEHVDTRIKEQVKDQLPQILPKEVSNFAPPVIEKLIKESRHEVTLAKIEKSEPYLTAPEHRDYYDGLKKSYALDKDFFYSYDVYSLKHGRKDKDKDEDLSVGSDRGKSVQSKEPVFEVADSDMPQDQEGNMGDNEDEPRNETAPRLASTSTDKSLKDFDELMSTPIDFSGYVRNKKSLGHF
ncbi:hypothetical protein Tco_0289974, partial [Tanacetum coccineum]